MNQEITDPVLVRALAGYYRHDPNPQVGPHVCKVEQHTSGKLLLKYAVIRTTEELALNLSRRGGAQLGKARWGGASAFSTLQRSF